MGSVQIRVQIRVSFKVHAAADLMTVVTVVQADTD